jgi:hypothetical protein
VKIGVPYIFNFLEEDIMFLTYKLFKELFSLFCFIVLVTSGCATPQIIKELNNKSFEINTNPPGANIYVSHHGSSKQGYLSPAPINISQGYGFIEISKEGYWDEDRLIVIGMKSYEEKTGSYLGSFLTGGLVGVIINPPREEIKHQTEWGVYNQTKMVMDAITVKSINASEYRDVIINDSIQVNLQPINPILKKTFATMGEISKKNIDKTNEELKKLYNEGKITKGDFLRARLKIDKLYYGKLSTTTSTGSSTPDSLKPSGRYRSGSSTQ